MATMDFTTKPLMLDWLTGCDRNSSYQIIYSNVKVPSGQGKGWVKAYPRKDRYI